MNGQQQAESNKPGTKNAGTQLQVLLVEDNSADAELVLRELRRGGFIPVHELVQAPEEFRRSVRARPPDVVLADYNLGQWRGMEALEILRQEGLDSPLILVSGALGDVTAVECIKQGVTDYVLKDSLTRLPISVRRALEERRLRAERKQARENLAAKVAELARSNQDLEQFAYVASHDLQEPLRMVASYTQLLAERYRGKLDAQADKYIAYAVEGASRMQTLIQDLLTFSRSARAELEMKNTDCESVVAGALRNLQSAIAESGAVILHDSLPQIFGNGTQLQQVFQNLIGNAIKFRGQDAPVIQIESERRGEDWLFSVIDNGIGIPVEHAATVFTIFKRLHTRTEYPGNGIGLAICKRIIEHNGGKIWLEPQRGAGTTFRFTLPAAADVDLRQPGEQNHEARVASAVGR
jgi:signal transduction histidine kinase